MTANGSSPASWANLELRSLRPNYVEADHGLYVSLLLKYIVSTTPSQNIAVSGAYGSGKSSVLEGLLAKLRANEVNAIQVSLATLNQSRKALLDVAGELTLTSALEKEVVKRLLYSVEPSQIPRSRFNRIGAFRPGPAAGIAAVTSALVTGAAQTFGFSLPGSQWVDTQEWWAWTAPALNFLSVGALVFCGLAALSSFRLSQIAIGPATLSLDDKDGNYFDHFLDEIIYFFQRTKVKVVLFEDLDRFNDAGIFLALRELNNLLNNSQQISQQVTFVYAIRDSLFVQAIESDDGEAEDPALPDAHARYGADSAASDRAKFFDLIVPVVPFISHEVAADLLLKALGDLPESLMPSAALVALAGRHFTDMRVILSIRNEFEVFAVELIQKSGMRGLSVDQLFAMVVYKHLHLDDFERIRTGESKLDAAVGAIRKAVVEMVAAADTAIAEVENAIETGAAVDQRSKAAGERLLAKLDITVKPYGRGAVQTVKVGGTHAFARADVPTRQFWESLAASQDPKLILEPSGPLELSAAEVAVLLGPDNNPKAWIRSQPQRDRQRRDALKEARSWLLKAPFSELLAGPFPSVGLGEGQAWTRVADVCGDTIGRGLPFELIRAGYLDQNFALYTTKFHGTILSVDARSYMMQYVDRHRSEPLFSLSPSDVDEILGRLGDALLDDPSALNVAIVDRLLEIQAPRLPVLLETAGQATEFLLTYLANGHAGDELLRRITSRRGDILNVIASASNLSDADRRNALSVCLSKLSGDLDYAVSLATVDVISQNLDGLPVLQEAVEPQVALAVAELLSANDLKLSDLSRVAEPLRTEVASVGSFVISGSNLQSLSQQPGAIGLDTLGGLDDGVGGHLIENLSEYLAAVRDTPGGSAVDEPGRLDDVVRAIVEHDPSELAEALGVLREGVIYDDLSSAPNDAYSDLARAGAFAVTRENVTQYVLTLGTIDAALAARLAETREIIVSTEVPDAEEEAARQLLATQIVGSDQLDTAAKIPLVVSLKTSTTLDVDGLLLVDPTLAGELLSAGEISDDLATFTALAGSTWPVFEACAARSSVIGSLVGDLAFTDELLGRFLESRSIAESVQQSVLSKFEIFQTAMGSSSSVAWMTAATRLDVPLTSGQLIALAQAGAQSRQLVDYVMSGKARLTTTELVEIFTHCDSPYSGLATANGATFTVPYAEDFRPVLQTLKAGGLVKEFHKKRMRDQFEIQMVG